MDIYAKAVIDSYITNNSVLETAKATGVSTVKVRKILITEGLWESDTRIKIGELLKREMTIEAVANTLYMSIKNVQAYMPYARGVYRGEELSGEAIRSGKYRNRMKKAASMQVLKTKDRNMMSGRMEEWASVMCGPKRSVDKIPRPLGRYLQCAETAH